MTTQTSFKQACIDFLLLAQSEDVIISKDLLQKRLDSVALTFNQANRADQRANAEEMATIIATAAEKGLQKPRLLAKTRAL